MEDFDVIQVAALYSCQSSVSLNHGSLSTLADSRIKQTIMQSYPFLCCQSRRQPRPVPEEDGARWARAHVGMHERAGKEDEASKWCRSSPTLLTNPTAAFVGGNHTQVRPQACVVAARPRSTNCLL